jgi:hypothetical protein
MPRSLLKRQMQRVLIVNELALAATADAETSFVSTPDATAGSVNSIT